MKNINEKNISRTDSSHCEKYHCKIDPESKNDSHAILLNYVTNNSIVLDVGCACGDMGYALKKYKNCTIYGFEYDEKAIVIAEKLNCYKELHQIDLNNISNIDYKSYEGLFDYIICGDVLEHLYNPKEVLRVLQNFLKKDGYFLISLPNISNALIKAEILTDNFLYTDTGLLDRTHIRFFSHKTIPVFLAENNLLIEDVKYTFLIIESCGVDPYKEIKNQLKKYIFSNNNSYVYQYIMKIKYNNSLNIEQCIVKNMVLEYIDDNAMLSFYKNEAEDKFYIKGNRVKNFIKNNVFNFMLNLKRCAVSVKIDGFIKTYKKIIKRLYSIKKQ